MSPHLLISNGESCLQDERRDRLKRILSDKTEDEQEAILGMPFLSSLHCRITCTS